jgi:hypothetical protein
MKSFVLTTLVGPLMVNVRIWNCQAKKKTKGEDKEKARRTKTK